MFTPLALLQQADPAAGLMSFLPLILVFAIFWFLVIAPTRKRQKELQAAIEKLQRGDRVITHGGLYGEVSAVEPAAVLLKIADGVKVRVAKSGIAGMVNEGDKAKG